MDDDDLPSPSNTPRSVGIEVAALILVVFAFVAVGVTIVLAVEASRISH